LLTFSVRESGHISSTRGVNLRWIPFWYSVTPQPYLADTVAGDCRSSLSDTRELFRINVDASNLVGCVAQR